MRTAPELSPVKQQAGGDDLIEQIHTAHKEFDKLRASKSRGAVDMDAFKEAFHESSADKHKLEEERLQEEERKKKAAKGGFLTMMAGTMAGGVAKAAKGAGRRVTQMTKAAARAVTPEKKRGRKYVLRP